MSAYTHYFNIDVTTQVVTQDRGFGVGPRIIHEVFVWN